jgi:hypothetical protein
MWYHDSLVVQLICMAVDQSPDNPTNVMEVPVALRHQHR